MAAAVDFVLQKVHAKNFLLALGEACALTTNGILLVASHGLILIEWFSSAKKIL